MVALGPGLLKIGVAGSETDYSCLVGGMTLTVDVTVGDSVFKLCGSEVPGSIVPAGTLAGTLDQDVDQTGGLFEFLSKNWGTSASFIFDPASAAGLEARGRILLTPMAFGGDTYGDQLTSDVSFQTVGDVDYYRAGTKSWTQTMSPKAGVPTSKATGATAGLPGSWTPAGSAAPASVTALQSASPAVVASPMTAWTTGQYVQTGTAGVPGQAHWSSTAWVAGPA